MKKLVRISALLLLLSFLLALGAAADDPWSEEYYRIIDYTDQLSDLEVESLDGDCIELLGSYHVDLALAAVSEEILGDISMETLGEFIYDDCSFGYGERRDGFMAVYNTDTEELIILCFGYASQRMDQNYRDFIISSAPGYREEHGLFGVLYAVIRFTSDYLADHASDDWEPAPAEPTARADKPDWYPEDPAHFQKYHDPDAPRVVDTADIFTDTEEAQMEARLREIRTELGKDIVVFTDVSAYGLGHDVYSADFYDFNGYGIGEEYEGVCLFVCMDPADRGFWTCCTGPETMGLFTERYANQLDDRLYDYMAAGDYGEGAADWIENFRNLYRTGMPFPPEWLPSAEGFTRTHDASALRVADKLGLLTDAEREALTKQAKAISDKYGLDVVILTAENHSSFYNWEYLERYYECMGYGFGENWDGILLGLLRDGDYSTHFYAYGFGKGSEKLNSVNGNRIEDKAFNRYLNDGVYESLRHALRDVKHMEMTGLVPRPWSYWGVMTLLGALVGAIFGGICLSGAKRKMAVPKVKETAGEYLDRNSLRIDNTLDQYLSTSTSRKYSPVERSSGGGSGGSSGGGSSYSSSYSGSSGTSHSGSGRSF